MEFIVELLVRVLNVAFDAIIWMFVANRMNGNNKKFRRAPGKWENKRFWWKCFSWRK